MLLLLPKCIRLALLLLRTQQVAVSHNLPINPWEEVRKGIPPIPIQVRTKTFSLSIILHIHAILAQAYYKVTTSHEASLHILFMHCSSNHKAVMPLFYFFFRFLCTSPWLLELFIYKNIKKLKKAGGGIGLRKMQNINVDIRD